jgi:phospholipid transport system substrate-binding protein
MRKLSLALTALLALTLPAVPASAGAPTDQLRKQVDQVVHVLDNPALKEKAARHDAVRKIAGEIFDYNEMAKRSLGTHWASRTSEQKQEFVSLFSDLLDRDQATVKTMIITPNGSEIPVDYRMHQTDGRWTVYDVSIQGVSLVANYRTQFNRVVTTESYESLVQKLKDKDATPAASPRS